jgi:cytochrome c-type biogenesis protein CcmH/NrfF
MPIAWLIPVTIVLLGAGLFARARRRSRDRVSFPQEPVSGQWLAEARSREEQHW